MVDVNIQDLLGPGGVIAALIFMLQDVKKYNAEMLKEYQSMGRELFEFSSKSSEECEKRYEFLLKEVMTMKEGK